MNKFYVSLGIVLICLCSCVNQSVENSDPLCQSWKYSQKSMVSETTTVTRDTNIKKDTSITIRNPKPDIQEMNEVGNMGPVKLKFNSDGTYEEEDVKAFVQTSESKGKWEYSADKKKLIETNETTGRTDTLTILNLSSDMLELQYKDTEGRTVTMTYKSGIDL